MPHTDEGLSDEASVHFGHIVHRPASLPRQPRGTAEIEFTPGEAVVFRCAVSRFAPPCPETMERMIARNREWFERVRTEFAEATNHYDPGSPRTPGQGIRTERSGR